MKINSSLILTRFIFIPQIFSKHCYVPGTVLGTKNTVVSKQHRVPAHPSPSPEGKAGIVSLLLHRCLIIIFSLVPWSLQGKDPTFRSLFKRIRSLDHQTNYIAHSYYRILAQTKVRGTQKDFVFISLLTALQPRALWLTLCF